MKQMRLVAATLAAAGLVVATPSAADARPAERASIESLSGDAEVRRIDVGMTYIDRVLEPRRLPVERVIEAAAYGAPVDEVDGERANPIHAGLLEGLERYRERWGGLPYVEIPSGATLRRGDDGERVRLLRERLGLSRDGGFDGELERAVRDYQGDHGLEVDGLVGAGMLASLNKGPEHYERLILINLERARAIPADPGRRYILVDAAAARLWLYEDGEVEDTMRVIVGKRSEQTPMMAALIRYAVLNPYWNIPPDLVRDKVAPAVLSEGLSYLYDRDYEILSDWTDDAEIVDPEAVDWEAVASGRTELRVRQRPGDGNMMGEIKFMLPNHFGVYLHDTPDKVLFEEADRRLSSGCVRLEDARRLARWVFGESIRPNVAGPNEHLPLEEPIPVYITYMTAAPSRDGGIAFRPDIYDRDPALLAQIDGLRYADRLERGGGGATKAARP